MSERITIGDGFRFGVGLVCVQLFFLALAALASFAVVKHLQQLNAKEPPPYYGR